MTIELYKLRLIPALIVIIALVAISLPVWAQEEPDEVETITEEQALALTLSRDAVVDRWEARTQSARARVLTERAWPNPTLGISREQVFESPSDATELSLVVEQLLPLSGRRGLLGSAAGLEADAVESAAAGERDEVVRLVRQAFYGMLSQQMVVEVREESLERLEETVERMNQRVESGESSRYELERLRQEHADLRAEMAIEEAELQRYRSTVRGWIRGVSTTQMTQNNRGLRAQGELLPAAIPADDEVIEAMDERPELIAVEQEIEGLEFRQQAAQRWWIPDVAFRAGLKSEAQQQRAFGFVAGLGFALPVFDQRRGERDAVQADLVEATSRRALNRDLIGAEALGYVAEARRLREATIEYGEEGVDRARRVLELAEQSYDAGEASILELVDAHNNVLNAQLRELELAHRCRQSFVELSRLIESTAPTESTIDERD